jgi:hypothetical protein
MNRIREVPTESAQDGVHVVTLRLSPSSKLFDLGDVDALLCPSIAADMSAWLVFVSHGVAHLGDRNALGRG